MNKKIPGSKCLRSGDVPFLSTEAGWARLLTRKRAPLVHSGRSSDSRITLLAAPSHQDIPNSGIVRLSSPITAAGPSLICTGFPFQLFTLWSSAGHSLKRTSLNHLVKCTRMIFFRKPSLLKGLCQLLRSRPFGDTSHLSPFESTFQAQLIPALAISETPSRRLTRITCSIL